MPNSRKSTLPKRHGTNPEFPLILALNSGGEPLRWITYERSAFYYAKNKVLWSTGSHEITLRGGVNAKTGEQSVLKMDTIVAIDGNRSPFKSGNNVSPLLTNSSLFHRDMNICAYCGGNFKRAELTRDHILPTSKGGPDIWDNVVTSCKACNSWKADRTPEEADMQMYYIPYTPSYHENLILMNKRILQCQMEFLLKGVSKNSRLRERYNIN